MGVLMRIVDRVIVLDHGEKIFEGAPARGGGRSARDRSLSRQGARLELDAVARHRLRRLRLVPALFDVSLEVPQGEAVGVIGPNGAGKTTLMRVISGLVPLRGGAMTFEGRAVGGLPAHRMVEQGIAHVPENRRLFPAPHRRGQPAHRRLHPAGARALRRAARAGLRAVSPPQGPARATCRHALGRRAADVRDRPRADVAAQAPADGRAVRRPRAARRRSRCSTWCDASAPKG